MKVRILGWFGLVAVVVIVLAGCSGSTKPDNRVPSMPQVNPVDFTIVPSGSILMTVSATDPDGDALTYAWTFTQGTPTTATGDKVTWTAPATNGTATATVKARDGRGGERSASTTLTIHPNAAYPVTYGRPFTGTLEPKLDDLAESGLASQRSRTCHFVASAMVGWSNVAVIAYTGLPTVAFLAGLTHTPVWLPLASSWVWSYAVPGLPNPTTVEVRAALSGSSGTALDWQMLVSGTVQQLNRFQWVTGHSDTEGRNGYWLLYDYRYPTQQIQALRVNYAYQSENDRELSYHNVRQGSDTFGDSLSYSILATDAQALWFSAAQATTTRALWDTLDGHGRLKAANGDSCCWGPRTGFEDLVCP
jgi:hypothetical protein